MTASPLLAILCHCEQTEQEKQLWISIFSAFFLKFQAKCNPTIKLSYRTTDKSNLKSVSVIHRRERSSDRSSLGSLGEPILPRSPLDNELGEPDRQRWRRLREKRLQGSCETSLLKSHKLDFPSWKPNALKGWTRHECVGCQPSPSI